MFRIQDSVLSTLPKMQDAPLHNSLNDSFGGHSTSSSKSPSLPRGRSPGMEDMAPRARRPRSASPSLSPRREYERNPSLAREDLMEHIRDGLVTGKLSIRDLENILDEFDFGKHDEYKTKPKKHVHKKGKIKNLISTSPDAPVELFVGNLHDSVQRAELKQLFSNFGNVINIERFKAKPIAFVTFSTKAEAVNAMEELSGTPYQGRSLRVNISRASQQDGVLPPKMKSRPKPKAFNKPLQTREPLGINNSWQCSHCNLRNRASSPYCFSCKCFRS